MKTMDIPDELPILISTKAVVLPGSAVKLSISNDSERAIVNKLLDLRDRVIGIVPKEEENQVVQQNDIGTAVLVVRISASTISKSSFIMVLGLQRIVIKDVLDIEPYQRAEINVHNDTLDGVDTDTLNLLESAKKILIPMIQKMGILPAPQLKYIKQAIDKVSIPLFVDILMSIIPTTFEEKLSVLTTLNVSERISRVMPIIMKHLGLDSLNKDDIKRLADKSSGLPSNVTVLKVLRPGVKEIPEYEDKDLIELHKKIQDANLPEYASKIVAKDLNRLKRMSHFSPDHSILRNYLEFVADLPWSVSSQETLDINKAREELDADHYGMDKLKKRILEYLAVRKLKTDIKGPILCFIGPPGVGKTSIGRSIAKILNKKFQRISLGGVSNQSEIRGHRRTYIGALPGRILEAIKNASTNNPLILLDEIDKLGNGIHGDPRAALLEVLDPEQNSNFTDHYLGMPFDLSQVTFIATANTVKTIPLPLLDRMEVISVSGYTPIEKFQIATRHLLPKQLQTHGLSNDVLQFTDEALHSLIMEYTKESGVRALERKLAAVCRSVAVKVAESTYTSLPIIVEREDLEEILGMAPYLQDEILKTPHKPGIALGLCTSLTGGSVIAVEVTRLFGGKGKLILTGCIGNVMKESAHIALNWVRSIAPKYGIMEESCDLMADSDLHIHFPYGAVSKEGPSAGITIACAILSLFTGIPIASGLAMTGELTLQGIVLPVGGIKGKLTAAHRLGLRKVIIPFRSKKELSDVSSSVLESLEIVLVEKMSDVIECAFDGSLIIPPNDTVLCSKL